jgi:hypothetical protein
MEFTDWPCKYIAAADYHLGVEEGHYHDLSYSGMDFGLHWPRHSFIQPLIGLLLGLVNVHRYSRLILSDHAVHKSSDLLIDQVH